MLVVISTMISDDVIVSFEKLNQDNGETLAIREGQSLQLCVIVESGDFPYEELFSVTPLLKFNDFEICSSTFEKRGIADVTTSKEHKIENNI